MAEMNEEIVEQVAEAAGEEAVLDASAFVEEKETVTEADTLNAVLSAILYVTETPMTVAALAQGLGREAAEIESALASLSSEYEKASYGFQVHAKAGGYYLGTKPEFDETLRQFFQSQKAPLKLSPAALETLCIIAYKQPVTAPEIAQIRGTQGVGSLKPLLDRKLITTAGRKDVVGKPVLYKTTPEFLLQFGLKDLKELPTLKEFEELRRLAMDDDMIPPAEPKAPQQETDAAQPETAEATSAEAAGNA
ncbi:MAG: SMC-Scp complex subunit ScpB [Bryobacter sp.]|nr:SMC-Scp complex subunit ScpB [Bryobacter sp.]